MALQVLGFIHRDSDVLYPKGSVIGALSGNQMVLKRPSTTSFAMPARANVELKTKYHSSGPADVKLSVNGDLEHVSSLPPSCAEATIEFSPEGPGEYPVELVVEVTPKTELQKLNRGTINQPEKREVEAASWNITVAEEDDLGETAVAAYNHTVSDGGLLYTIADICFRVYTNWRMIIEDLILLMRGTGTETSEKTQGTTGDFQDSYVDDDDD